MVLFCPNIGLLSTAVLSLVPLIRPFAWQSLLLPILPALDKMLDLLEAPVPFILGVQVSSPMAKAACPACIAMLWTLLVCLQCFWARWLMAAVLSCCCRAVQDLGRGVSLRQPDQSQRLQGQHQKCREAAGPTRQHRPAIHAGACILGSQRRRCSVCPWQADV